MTGKTSSALIGPLEWAAPAQDVSPKVSLDNLLVGLALLATDDDQEKSQGKPWDGDTPVTVQAIESSALAITQSLAKWIKNAGGILAAVTLASGGLATILQQFAHAKISNSIIVTLFGGAFFFLSAAAIALALLVQGDLQARGTAAAARHVGRAQVAAEFLRATAALRPATLPAQAAGGTQATLCTLWVRPIALIGTETNAWCAVLAYSKREHETLYFIQAADGLEPQWKSVSDLDGWKVSATNPGIAAATS